MKNDLKITRGEVVKENNASGAGGQEHLKALCYAVLQKNAWTLRVLRNKARFQVLPRFEQVGHVICAKIIPKNNN
jgi:hypothetical protein